MSPLAILLLGLPLLIGIGTWLSARPGPRDPSDLLGLRTARQIMEDREALEAEDLAQLLEAHNARRRRRGERERTLRDVEVQVAADAHEQRRWREALTAQRDLDDLLQTSNARRRAIGLPERTEQELRDELGSELPSA